MSTSAVQSQITSAATTAGVNPALALAVAQQESGFNQNAVSPAGAIGVFQLMPGTAAGLGVDPTDLNDNISGGITYLQQLLSKYNGNTTLALAAYNAGPGAVAQYGGVPPYAETQNYVSSILSQMGGSGDSGALAASSDPSDVVSDAGIDLTDPVTLLILAGAGGLVWWFFIK